MIYLHSTWSNESYIQKHLIISVMAAMCRRPRLHTPSVCARHVLLLLQLLPTATLAFLIDTSQQGKQQLYEFYYFDKKYKNTPLYKRLLPHMKKHLK